MVVIERTSFVMGSLDGDDNERPVHEVTLDAFEIAACPVTNAEYARFRQPPCSNDPAFNDAEQPVVAVSWFDATAYCEWLSGITGRTFRLPTEAREMRQQLSKPRRPMSEDCIWQGAYETSVRLNAV